MENKSFYTDGLIYRKNQLGIHLSKMPLYLNSPKYLEICLNKANHEYEVLCDHLTFQNIQDGISRTSAINEAIARDANQSPNYLITGVRKLVKNNNGTCYFEYLENLKIVK